FEAEGFTPRDHVELGRILGAIDIERGAKVSGSRFYYLTGPGADLELALVNLAMDQARSAGFTTMIPPALVKPRAMEGTGFLGQAADDVYRIEGEDLYLVGTSEVAMAAYHSDEILDPAALPLRYAAFSPCFRKEAGSHGKDTKGIIRVHWFDKVEMFVYTTVEESYAEHQRLLEWEKEFLDMLELHYRVIDVAAGDLGTSAQRKFDCEAWISSQGRFRELTSTSNCTDFQSRRLDIRTRTDGAEHGGSGATVPVATLNGTLCSTNRPMIALLETHQQEDGSVRVPKALQPYMGGLEVLEPLS
ncbi:MAG: serS, partial [Nocardioides sp.]|nr:serS [Nocardioides sp.]